MSVNLSFISLFNASSVLLAKSCAALLILAISPPNTAAVNSLICLFLILLLLPTGILKACNVLPAFACNPKTFSCMALCLKTAFANCPCACAPPSPDAIKSANDFTLSAEPINNCLVAVTNSGELGFSPNCLKNVSKFSSVKPNFLALFLVASLLALLPTALPNCSAFCLLIFLTMSPTPSLTVSNKSSPSLFLNLISKLTSGLVCPLGVL